MHLPKFFHLCCSLALLTASCLSGAAVAQTVNADPLAGLPPAVDLPPVDNKDWAALSKIAVPDELVLIFRLIGGDRCLPGGRRFETKELAGNRSWQCLIVGGAGTEPVEVAKFRVQGGEFQFAWSP